MKDEEFAADGVPPGPELEPLCTLAASSREDLSVYEKNRTTKWQELPPFYQEIVSRNARTLNSCINEAWVADTAILQ